MGARIWSTLLFAFLFSGLAALKAQTQDAPTIRSSSSLVLVPVSAVDKSGHFVSNLTARDFQVHVDGKPVDIKSFDALTEASPQASGGSAAAEPLPPGTFRNISDFSASQPNLVILFIDYLNTRLADRMGLREGMLKYLAKLKPDQEIAAYGLTERLVLLQPFTRDSSALITVAKELLNQKGQSREPVEGKPLVKPGSDPITYTKGHGADAGREFLDALNARKEFNLDQLHRAQVTLDAFRELAGSFGGIPGKKTVIWLTGDASPLNPSLLYRILVGDRSAETVPTPWSEMAKTYEALNAAGISIFPLDIRGITNPGLLSAGNELTHDQFDQTIRASQPDDLTSYANATDQRQGEAANAGLAMSAVAGETGGTVLAGSNNIEDLLGRAQKLWSSYYVLAFAPERPAENSPPAYHKIKVSVDRGGVQILARRGYVSRPESLISAETEIQRDLVEAATSPVDLSSVALQLNLRESPPGGAIRHHPFSVKVSSALLGTMMENGAPFDMSIAVLVRDQDGKFGTPFGKRLRGTVPQAALSKVAANGMQYDGEFETPASGRYFGRVVVRDNLTGRIGTITLALPTAP